ncbi:hypothetical protein [Ktedonobacter racemifer]|uniref:Uncharacterized protein n=1 Tax=Ktedonobacter racemifer DSM 44963 TaxID=485913 RepID=D6TVW1_KTERA|nr:hypothetical protein [Ktedonobacter racemifer]EFH84344.1 hypothetical protein Krac_5375 [Ktedonobacter racemifer DSM 44963]
MTSNHVSIDTLPAEEAANWLQSHLTTWTAYACALAQQGKLSPEDAARLFMQPVSLTAGEQADAQVLERQARQSATVMVLMHGASNVSLEREDDSWLLKAALGVLRDHLDSWHVELAFFAHWLNEQARLVGLAKGIDYTTWLEGDVLHMRLSLLEAGQV